MTEATLIKFAEMIAPVDTRPPADDCPVRAILNRVGDEWTFLVLLNLVPGPSRFNALQRSVKDVSQRMLTVTLRNLERDGLVTRRVTPTTPPQVDYSLSELGQSLTARTIALAQWAKTHDDDVKAAQRNYDARAAYDQAAS